MISYKDGFYYKDHTPIKIHNPKYRLKEVGDEKYGFPEITNYGIFIDIFIIQEYRDNVFDRIINKYYGRILLAYKFSRLKGQTNRLEIRIAKFIPRCVINYLNIMIEFFMQNRHGDYMGFGYKIPFYNLFMKKIEFYPLQKYEFEGLELFGPNNIEKYLSQRYGNFNTLPSKSNRKSHIIEI